MIINKKKSVKKKNKKVQTKRKTNLNSFLKHQQQQLSSVYSLS